MVIGGRGKCSKVFDIPDRMPRPHTITIYLRRSHERPGGAFQELGFGEDGRDDEQSCVQQHGTLRQPRKNFFLREQSHGPEEDRGQKEHQPHIDLLQHTDDQQGQAGENLLMEVS